MSVVVTCPKCATMFRAPAADDRVRCPNCDTPVPIEGQPAGDAAPSPPTPVAVVGQPRKPFRGDEPARHRGKTGSGKVALIVLGGLLLLVGVGVYKLVGKSSTPAKKSPVPPGWEQYSYTVEGFKVYLPKKPNVSNTRVDKFDGLEGPSDKPRDEDWITVFGSGDPNDPVVVKLAVTCYRDGVPARTREGFRIATGMKPRVGKQRTVQWLGYDTIENTRADGVTRMVFTDRCFFEATVSGLNGGRATPEEEAGFFDNIELTK